MDSRARARVCVCVCVCVCLHIHTHTYTIGWTLIGRQWEARWTFFRLFFFFQGTLGRCSLSSVERAFSSCLWAASWSASMVLNWLSWVASLLFPYTPPPLSSNLFNFTPQCNRPQSLNNRDIDFIMYLVCMPLTLFQILFYCQPGNELIVQVSYIKF